MNAPSLPSWIAKVVSLAALLAAPLRADDPATQAAPTKAKAPKQAAAAEAGPKFIRLDRDAKDQPLALQTAIASFTANKPGQAGVVVDLIGAVHVGELSYYQALNEAFEKYDVVLYELVAPPGTRIPKGAKSGGGHPVSLLQNGMKDMLGLEHQLSSIDYTKDNLVHADMSPDEFSKSMKDRGESVFQMMFRAMGYSMAQQGKAQAKQTTNDLDVLLALFDPKKRGTLKRYMAEQFEDVEGMMEAVNGPDGSTLISERNKVAMAELARQIAGGKRRIAIFYGAAHLPDMQKRLLSDEFGMKQAGERWLTAWNLADKPD